MEDLHKLRKLHVFVVLWCVAVVFLFAQIEVIAKDDWLRVQSKNFHLIGNASEKDIRKVATKLEQFRETFRLLLSKAIFNSAIPTNVIVFKNSSSYKNFKPKRADGKIDEWVAGYFQSGSDVNYITLSIEREESQTYGIIFHEYIHFLVDNNFGKGEIPPWFNEGLAEYYQTFEIEQDIKVKLGLPQLNHLELLKQSKLIPLQDLFNVTNYSLKQNGNHSRSIFYAQAWALVHYLMQSSQGTKSGAMFKFLDAVLNKVPLEKAFQESFQMTFAEMEKELKKYISQATYVYQESIFKQKLVFESEMQMSPLSEADTNAYLGDLLFRIQRLEDAEPYLQKALVLEPNSSLANISLGSLKIRHRKFDEAQQYLEKAITGDPKNHMAYYNYAYLVSREGMDEFGFVSQFNAEKVAQMRTALNKAISLNPTFMGSYELLGFINLVNNEQLEETVQLLRKALNYSPGDQDIIIRIAEIMTRQEKFEEAIKIANRIAAVTDDDSIRSRAEDLKNRIPTMQNIKSYNENARRQYEEARKNSGQSRLPLTRRQKEPTPDEINKAREAARMVSLNQSIKKPNESQKQIIGRIQKITCANNNITYSVKTESGDISLSSKDFQNLALMAFDSEAENAQIGCNSNLSKYNAVLTYQGNKPPKPNSLGELIAIDFVPTDFRLMSETEIESATALVDQIDNSPPPPSENTQMITTSPNSGEMEEMRRNAMMKAINDAISKPKEGEKREQGFVEKVECDNKSQYFVMKTATQTMKLKAPSTVAIRAFTPDAGGQEFGCGMKSFDISAVFIYKPDSNPKAKVTGELISIDFVPKTFKLEN